MAVEDRFVALLANFIHGDENALSLEDPLWSNEGGPVEEIQASELLDEIEGEFGIKVRDREVEDLTTLSDLLNLIEKRVNGMDGSGF